MDNTMILEITKTAKIGNRNYKKGKQYRVPLEMLQWKAEELIKAKVAKYQKKDIIETIKQ
jgi:hypothetical protein